MEKRAAAARLHFCGARRGAVVRTVAVSRRIMARRARNESRACGTDGRLMAEILVGTSGWHYASWKGPFFPNGLKLKDQLAYYATQFRTTELNGVFYRTPTPEAVKAWREQTPPDFVFAWKASKFITH